MTTPRTHPTSLPLAPAISPEPIRRAARPEGVNMNRKTLVDFTERVAATFAQAFLALAVVSHLSDVSELKAAAVAGGLAAGKFALVAANAYLNKPSS